MATQWQTFPIEFRGGLISNLSPLQQGTNAVGSATILQNFEASKDGGYTKIKGYEKYSDTAIAGSGPVLAIKIASSEKTVVSRRNTSDVTEYYYGGGTTWTSITSMPLLGGKARHVSHSISGIEKTIFVDGVNYPVEFNNSDNSLTTLDSSTDVLAAEHVAVFKGTAFYAKGSVVYFSAPLSVGDFSVANGAGSINVGSDVTGLIVFRDQLIIFTQNTIKRVTGTTASDFVIAPITDRIGCVNGDTIQEVGGDIMYLAPDGIRLLSATDRIGDFGLEIASDPIAKDTLIFTNSTSEYCSLLLREKAQYRIFAYIESEQPATTKGLIATKFISQGGSGIGWSTTSGIKAYTADSAYIGSSEVILFGNSDGYIYQMETGSSFDGESIEAIYESPYMPINDPQVRKTLYKMTLYAEPTGDMQLTVNIKYDFDINTGNGVIQPPTSEIASSGTSTFLYGSTKAVYGTAAFGGELDNVYNLNLVGSGKTVAIRFEDNSINPTFTLDTVLLEFRQNDRQ
jgi:hypothetical protein